MYMTTLDYDFSSYCQYYHTVMSNSPFQISNHKDEILPQRLTAQLFTVNLCSLGLHLHQRLKASVYMVLE